MNTTTCELRDETTVLVRLDLLSDRIQRSLGGRVRNFQVTLLGHGLMLSGWTRTYHAKQLAQHHVMAELDVPIIANDIEVR